MSTDPSEDALLQQALVRLEGEMNDFREKVSLELESGTERMTCISDQVEEVSATLQTLAARIETVVSIFQTGDKVLTFFVGVGNVAKWFAMVGGSIALILYFLKTGHWK